MKLFKKIRLGNKRTIYLFGFRLFSYTKHRSKKSVLKENEALVQQLEYIKSNIDIKYLKPATGKLREQQLELVKFATDFFELIRELDIKPFLLCGNLLGHVRHNGFIPWDDDLDFGLMREDYEKLIKYCEKNFVVCRYNKKISEYDILEIQQRLYDRCTQYPNQYVLDVFYYQLQLSYGDSLDNQKFIDFWVFDYFDDNYDFDTHKKYLEKIALEIKNIDYVDKITDFLRRETKSNKYIVKKSNQIYFGLDCLMSYSTCNESFIKSDILFPLRLAEYEGGSFYVPNKPELYLPFEFKQWASWPKQIGWSHHNWAKEKFIKERLKK